MQKSIVLWRFSQNHFRFADGPYRVEVIRFPSIIFIVSRFIFTFGSRQKKYHALVHQLKGTLGLNENWNILLLTIDVVIPYIEVM